MTRKPPSLITPPERRDPRRITGNDNEPYFLVQPPSTMTVEHEYRPLLYQADGTALIRRAGF